MCGWGIWIYAIYKKTFHQEFEWFRNESFRITRQSCNTHEAFIRNLEIMHVLIVFDELRRLFIIVIELYIWDLMHPKRSTLKIELINMATSSKGSISGVFTPIKNTLFDGKDKEYTSDIVIASFLLHNKYTWYIYFITYTWFEMY